MPITDKPGRFGAETARSTDGPAPEKTKLAASNDSLEASLDSWLRKNPSVDLVTHVPSQRGAARLAPAELAPAIREQNLARTARAERSSENEEVKENARVEILKCIRSLGVEISRMRAENPDLVLFFDMLIGFHSGMSEYLIADVQKSAPKRSSGLDAMKEAIASLNRTQGVRG